MGWNMDLRGMQQLRSFEACENYFRTVPKPTARSLNWGDDERPLDGPRKHAVRLVKAAEGQYRCVLYTTTMVAYFSTGEVAVTLDARRASLNYLDSVLPSGMSYCKETRGPLMLRVHSAQATEWLQHGTLPIVLAPDGLHRWRHISGAEQRLRTFYDPKKASPVRRALRPTLDLLRATQALAREKPTEYDEHQLKHVAADALRTPLERRQQLLVRMNPCPKALLTAAIKVSEAYERKSIPNTEPPVMARHHYADS